jgi:type II secretory pathway component GspD/PulD (secretin)
MKGLYFVNPNLIADTNEEEVDENEFFDEDFDDTFDEDLDDQFFENDVADFEESGGERESEVERIPEGTDYSKKARQSVNDDSDTEQEITKEALDPEDFEVIEADEEEIKPAERGSEDEKFRIGGEDEPTISFTARNIPVRDAFATLARISGKSITVSGDIKDRQTISVVEINEQTFTDAFLSLVRAADVDFIVRGKNNFTILKPNNRSNVRLFSALESSGIDTSKPIKERLSNLTFDNQDIGSIIKDLANRYGVDIMMTAQPSERVTVKLNDINIVDALTLILSGSQFKFTQNKDTFIIYNASNKNFDLFKENSFIPLKYQEAKEIVKLLPENLKKLAKASDKQNAIIASGSAEELAQLRMFIDVIDKPIPQVELDVKLVEVNEAFRRAITPYRDSFNIGAVGSINPDIFGGDNIISGFSTNLGTDQWQVFSPRPSFNQTSNNGQIKVSQKLLVTSGKSAKINFDQDVNVVLNSAQNQNGGNIGVVQNQQIQTITAGNSLNITPIVGEGGIVTVQVEVEVSANGAIDETTGVPQTTTRRKISSEIQIENHRTIVIGGIFDDQKSRGTSNEIPVLSKIPILGSLFSNNTKQKALTELMILITPHLKDSDLPEVQNFYPTN